MRRDRRRYGPASGSTRPTGPGAGAGGVSAVEEVSVWEQRSLEALQASLGETSLCALARDGRSHPAAKFHEGSARALAALRRALRHSADRPRGAVAREERDRWQDEVGPLASRSADWSAYHAGGIDALDRALEAWGEPRD